MATPTSKQQQAKELHQLKLKLTKDPRATSVKVLTPTKQHPTKAEATSSPVYPAPPAAKILKLADVLSLAVANQGTSHAHTKTIPLKGTSQHILSASHPPTIRSPKQHVVIVPSEPVTVKSPARKRPIVVGSPQQVKQMRQQQMLSGSAAVASRSPKAKPTEVKRGELLSVKPKPPPLKLVVEEGTKKKSSTKSQSILPTSRVRTIMKTNIKSSTSDGQLQIGQDSVAVISKATVCASSSCNIIFSSVSPAHVVSLIGRPGTRPRV